MARETESAADKASMRIPFGEAAYHKYARFTREVARGMHSRKRRIFDPTLSRGSKAMLAWCFLSESVFHARTIRSLQNRIELLRADLVSLRHTSHSTPSIPTQLQFTANCHFFVQFKCTYAITRQEESCHL